MRFLNVLCFICFFNVSSTIFADQNHDLLLGDWIVYRNNVDANDCTVTPNIGRILWNSSFLQDGACEFGYTGKRYKDCQWSIADGKLDVSLFHNNHLTHTIQGNITDQGFNAKVIYFGNSEFPYCVIAKKWPFLSQEKIGSWQGKWLGEVQSWDYNRDLDRSCDIELNILQTNKRIYLDTTKLFCEHGWRTANPLLKIKHGKLYKKIKGKLEYRGTISDSELFYNGLDYDANIKIKLIRRNNQMYYRFINDSMITYGKLIKN